MIEYVGKLISKCLSYPQNMKVMFLDLDENKYYNIEGIGQFEAKMDTVILAGRKENDTE